MHCVCACVVCVCVCVCGVPVQTYSGYYIVHVELHNCETLEDIDNGSVDMTGVTPGSTATYNCNQDYQLKGPATRTCLADGTWSGTEPTCIGESVCAVSMYYQRLRTLHIRLVFKFHIRKCVTLWRNLDNKFSVHLVEDNAHRLVTALT